MTANPNHIDVPAVLGQLQQVGSGRLGREQHDHAVSSANSSIDGRLPF